MCVLSPDKKSLISLEKRKASPKVKEEDTKQISVLSPSPCKMSCITKKIYVKPQYVVFLL